MNIPDIPSPFIYSNADVSPIGLRLSIFQDRIGSAKTLWTTHAMPLDASRRKQRHVHTLSYFLY
jgi:hypothetical protein